MLVIASIYQRLCRRCWSKRRMCNCTFCAGCLLSPLGLGDPSEALTAPLKEDAILFSIVQGGALCKVPSIHPSLTAFCVSFLDCERRLKYLQSSPKPQWVGVEPATFLMCNLECIVQNKHEWGKKVHFYQSILLDQKWYLEFRLHFLFDSVFDSAANMFEQRGIVSSYIFTLTLQQPLSQDFDLFSRVINCDCHFVIQFGSHLFNSIWMWTLER